MKKKNYSVSFNNTDILVFSAFLDPKYPANDAVAIPIINEIATIKSVK